MTASDIELRYRITQTSTWFPSYNLKIVLTRWRRQMRKTVSNKLVSKKSVKYFSSNLQCYHCIQFIHFIQRKYPTCRNYPGEKLEDAVWANLEDLLLRNVNQSDETNTSRLRLQGCLLGFGPRAIPEAVSKPRRFGCSTCKINSCMDKNHTHRLIAQSNVLRPLMNCAMNMRRDDFSTFRACNCYCLVIC